MMTPPSFPDPEEGEDNLPENTDDYLCPTLPAKLFRVIAGLIRKAVENPLILLIIFGFAVIVFGIAGYSEYYASRPGTDKTFSDFVYQTLQLFVLNSTDINNLPLTLEIARFCAVVFVALTFVSVVMKIFWEQVQGIWLWVLAHTIRDPKAIICGLGYLGPGYAWKFRRRGYRTVVIEKDPAHTTAGLPGSGLVFIKGDATDPAVLRRVHIRDSDILVLVTGDDLTNMQIATAAGNAILNKKSGPNLSPEPAKSPVILIHILDRWLDNALRNRFLPLYKDHHPPPFFPFNMYTQAAGNLVPSIWKEIVQDQPGGDLPKDRHLLLIGVGTMGEEICKQFIERWNKEIKNLPGKKPCLTLTLIDYKDAGDKAQRLQQWINEKKCPENTVVIHPHLTKVPSADFMDGKYLQEDPDDRPVPPVSAVIICLANQTLAMTTALEIVPIMKRNLAQSPGQLQDLPPVYIRFIRNDEITRFIHILKTQEPFSIFKPYTIAENGEYWNDELDAQFKEKPCRFLRFCPFTCRRKKRGTHKE
ncbi:MAG: NAD-binding protein [Methanoregula sp.]|jgi:hypothetical protein